VTFTDGTAFVKPPTDNADPQFGPNREDWIGKIEVYRGTLRYNGSDNPPCWCGCSKCYRLRMTPLKPQPVEDEVPFN
jgi:hypothetical protein